MKSILLICLLFVSVFSSGQTKISGTVKQSDGSPVIGASIMIKGSYDGGITNPTGQFSFSTNLSDTVVLIARFIGFEPQYIPIDLSQKIEPLNITLMEKRNELDVVTITAGSFEAGDKKKAVMLTSLDMVTTPGASGNVVNALQFLPGTTTNGESGKLFVRGGGDNESQTFIDGTLVHNPYNASAPNTAVRSRFNPFMFNGTVFSTGGFSAEYGQALSSVLLLETKGIQEKDQLDISLLSVGLGLAGTKKWDKGAVTASVDYTNLTPYMSIIPQDIDWIKMPESTESAISLRQKTKKGLIKLYGNYSQSNFELNNYNLNTSDSEPLNLLNKNTYINASYLGQLNENWTVNLGGAYTHYIEDIGINTNTYSETTDGTHFKMKLKRNFGKNFKLKTGVELLSKAYHQNFTSSNGSFPFSFTNHQIGGFVETDIYLSQKLVTRIGGRYEYSHYLNKSNIAPRISMAYKLSKTSQVSLAGGLFYQNPDQDYLIYSNQLNFEHTKQYMLNYTFSKNQRSVKAEVYLKDYDQLVKFDPSNAFYETDYYTNKGKGYAYGLDLFFRDRKTIKNGDYWVSYSYIDTERNYLNFPTSAVPGFVSKHNISVVYKHWIRKWRTLFGASFNYSSPRFYNDPNLSTFNSEKIRAYQALNLNASYLYRENIIFYASATNVLGYKQEFGYQFSDTPNSEGIYEKSLITPPAPRFFILGCFITLSKTGDQNQLDKIN